MLTPSSDINGPRVEPPITPDDREVAIAGSRSSPPASHGTPEVELPVETYMVTEKLCFRCLWSSKDRVQLDQFCKSSIGGKYMSHSHVVRSLRRNGDVLSREASMTCLMLACCRCDLVPALLFTRPYDSLRRWNNSGEILLADPPPADVVPSWPLTIFVDATESPRLGKEDLSEGNSERFQSPATLGLPRRLSPTIEHLCQQNIISTELDGEDIIFRMAKSIREQIWEQTRTQDRLLLWFDLLKLIIYSSPDVYAEIFWQGILRSCKPVIDSTLLPFLSVLEWTQLQYHKPM